MAILHTQINTRSPEFAANSAAMLAQVDDLRALLARVHEGGGAKAQERHTSRGKLLPRERINRLLDAGSPFLEIGQLAAYEVYGEDVPAAGVVAGIGRVEGVECMIVANDATVKGGSYYPLTVKKAPARADHRPAEPPAVHLSGRLRRRQPAGAGRGLPGPRAFRPHLLQPGQHERAGIPQIAAVWAPAPRAAPMCRPCRMKRSSSNQGTIFLGGPPLVKAATGEEVSAEDLGGGDMHSRTSGVTDHLAIERRPRAGHRPSDRRQSELAEDA